MMLNGLSEPFGSLVRSNKNFGYEEVDGIVDGMFQSGPCGFNDITQVKL